MGAVEMLLLLTAIVGLLAQGRVLSGDLDIPVPGSSHKVSKNDTGVQKAALVGTYAFNNQSNDVFLFKVFTIKDARIQMVKGIKYILDAEISRTVCRKNSHTPDLRDCRYQPKGKLHQTFICHFEVWVIPWQNWMKTTALVCHP